ncbi:PA0069 family radical SAM protein [Aliiroseovarius subalbicans]|uniref:PA0069 family radical SAM protein n=1 Tax=Aliiroseovarius subalbicans TaxID=2925840 RepID=UPI001F5741F7|nr:PA0069 family radical SAM protein [Aliiroseovarius subalbicans]MCI2398204.1 PA0069 family radical SAM protein [Aliiroseovarius subalbicans]
MTQENRKPFAPQHPRGRAARSNLAGRFEPYQVESVDDGWEGAEGAPLRTEVAIERPRRVITRNASPDLGFDRSLNPYRGCEHGCIYCFARPSHAYLGLSPGLDFETRLIARPTAPDRLREELSRPRYQVAPLAIGTNTDPYQPIERTHRVMRGVLQVLSEFHHPVGVVTKGTLIERDLDLLGAMAQAGLAKVGVSITTLDPVVSRAMEPRVPSPVRRLKMIERLARAGVSVRVMVAPVVPGLTDHEVEAIVAAARDAGAQAASYILLRLPVEVAPLFTEWLEAAFPDRASRVMGRLREMRGGADYDATFGTRMVGQGEFAALLARRFAVACKRAGLSRDLPDLRRDLFRVPPRAGDQLSLF